MTSAAVFIVVAILVMAALLLRKHRGVFGPEWRIGYSPGMPNTPVMQGSGWYFDFPTDPASHVHYVQWFKPPALVGSLYVKFTVTGGGFIAPRYPGETAVVSLLIQRKGDDWTAQGKYQGYRWFSSAIVTLADGQFEITAPLNVASWSDVEGGRDPAAFAEAIRNVENVGLVFGVSGGRGHGVYATEPSRFTLLEIGTI